MDDRETVAQQWTAAQGDGKMLTLLNNGVYGSDFAEGEIRTSLIRGAAYTAHPIGDRVIMPQDRFLAPHGSGRAAVPLCTGGRSGR